MKTKIILLTAMLVASNALAADGLTLSWQDNSDNETGFNVEASEDGGEFVLIGTVEADDNEFVHSISKEKRAVVYTYRVNAFNNFGVSGYTNTVSARLKDYEAPDSPSNPVIKVPQVIINAENVTINSN